MSFPERHQTIHVNYRGSYIVVKVKRELDDRSWGILTTCEAHFDRHCEKCHKPGNGGLVLRATSDRGLSFTLQDLMNKVKEAMRKKRLAFNDQSDDKTPKGFYVPTVPPIMCMDCTHWPHDKAKRPVYDWHPATCPGGADMNIFDGQPYLRAEYDASDCEHFAERERKK